MGEETSGRVVSDSVETKQTGSLGVTVNNNDSTTPIRLTQLTLLTNIRNDPLDYTEAVQNAVLQPEEEFDLPGINFEFDLATGTRYTFFATVTAEPLYHVGVDADGSPMQCNNNAQIECIL